MSGDRSYDDDEVRAIIDRALKAQPKPDVSHEDLLAIGAGVGLSTEVLESAAREVRDARDDDAVRRRVIRRRRRGVWAHALVFGAVNACLFLINFLTTPGEWWVLFPIFGWGLGLVLHAGFALFRDVSPARLNRERRRLEPRSAGSKLVRIATASSKEFPEDSAEELQSAIADRDRVESRR